MTGQPSPNAYGWTTIDATPAHAYLWPSIHKLLPPLAKGEAPPRVLDLGCGNGYVASRLHALGYRTSGIDASPDGIALARQAYPHIRFEVVSIYDDIAERLDEANFDVVVSSEVIEHLYSPRRLLDNAYALLKPSGSMIVTTPYHGYLKNLALSLADKWDDHHLVAWDGGHIKFFSKHTLTVMLRDVGFENIEFRNAGRVRWLWKSIVCRAHRPNR